MDKFKTGNADIIAKLRLNVNNLKVKPRDNKGKGRGGNVHLIGNDEGASASASSGNDKAV